MAKYGARFEVHEHAQTLHSHTTALLDAVRSRVRSGAKPDCSAKRSRWRGRAYSRKAKDGRGMATRTEDAIAMERVARWPAVCYSGRTRSRWPTGATSKGCVRISIRVFLFHISLFLRDFAAMLNN